MCSNGEKEGKLKKLCPVSLGLAVGLVSFFAVLLWSLGVIFYGFSTAMIAMHLPITTLGQGFVVALLALLKGFLFGFFVALLYDVISCCVRCRKSCEKCGCHDTCKDKKL